MRGKVILLVVLLAGAAFALLAPGASDLVVIIGLLALLGSLIVAAGLVRAGLARLLARLLEGSQRRPVIVVDGSNVMHWRDDVPSVATLLLVLADLSARGYAPQVYFDANIGYKLFGRAVAASDLARRLGLKPAQVTLAPSRTPADPLLLGHAVRVGARVVSNDRFMDWRAAFPRIGERGFLVTGKVKAERVELRFVAGEAG